MAKFQSGAQPHGQRIGIHGQRGEFLGKTRAARPVRRHPLAVEQLEGETQGEWYLRQMLGSANFSAGPAMAFMSGNLCYQIEHHLFPDLPANRYQQIAPQVREIAGRYGLPYNSRRLSAQLGSTWRKIVRMALPTRAGEATA